jgi:hypothetical protein
MFNTFPYLHLLGEYDRNVYPITCDSDYYEVLSKKISGRVVEVNFVTYISDPRVEQDTVLVLGRIDGIWYPVCSYWEDEIVLTDKELLGKTPKEIDDYWRTLELGHGIAK